MFHLVVLLSTLSLSLAGYAGSYSDNNVNGPPFGFVPPFPGEGDINGYLQNFYKILATNRYNAFSYSITSNEPSSTAQAQSSLQKIQENVAAGIPQGFPQGGGGYGYASGPGAHAGSFGGGFGGGPGTGGAAASATIGNKGVHQTASVYPENPNAPNINERFGGGPEGGGGSYSVFTSSQSATSDVGGKPVHFHRASTTVNDNGKVTTYTVRNP